MMDEKRVRVIVHGHVQAVGFRAACQAEAVAAGIRGWVKNKWDGSVEALFEGPAAAVDHMLLWCERGPRAADVDFVEQHEASEPAPHGSFRVR